MKQSGSVGFISFSAFLHAGVLLALVMVPALKMLPEGEEAVVEIISDATSSPARSTNPAPAPVADAPKPVESPADKPIEKPAPKVAKALPAKKAQPVSPKIIPVDMTQDKDVEKAQDEAERFAKEQAEEVKPVLEEAPAKPIDHEREVIENTAQAAAVEAVSRQEKMEEVEPLPAPTTNPVVQRLGDIQEKPAIQDEPPATDVSGDGSGEMFGPSTDELRSYLELKQVGSNRPPQYPVSARRNGYQGEVMLNYFVTQSGQVKDVRVARSSGFGELDKEAVRAISQYKYVPGQEGWTEHPVIFSLKGPAASAPSRLRTSGSSINDNSGN